MPLGWRLTKAKHAANAFSGEGARRFGGRWNSRGVAMIYLSEHQSLAALEIFVHRQPLSPRDEYVMIAAEWDEGLMERLTARALSDNWRVSPPGPATTAIGDRWVREARSAVLAVPSAIILSETNFLINPAHPNFRRVRIRKPIAFEFDQRMLHR